MSNSCGAMRELSAVLISVFCIQYQATKPTPQEGEQPSCKEHNKWYIYIYKYNIYIIIYIIPTYSNIRYCNIATMPPRKPHNTGCHRMSQVHTIGTKAAPCFTKTYGNLEESNRLNLEQRISCVPSSKSAHDNMATLSSLPVSIPSCVQYQSVAFAFVFALILQLSAKLCKYVSILVKKLPPKAWLRIAWA